MVKKKKKTGEREREHHLNAATREQERLPFVDDFLILLIGLHKPLADAYETAVHEAALQQVVDGFEQERATLIRQAAFPLAVLLA